MDEPAFGEPQSHEGLRPEEADVVAQAGRHDAHAPGGDAEAEALDLPTGGGEPALALVARHAAPDDDELGVEDVHEADTDGGEGAAGGGPGARRGRGGPSRSTGRWPSPPAVPSGPVRSRPPLTTAPPMPVETVRETTSRASRDRKSTHLNSTHTYIS